MSLMTFLSIETCRLLPPFPLKVTNLRMEAAVLFFRGQSAMYTQHVVFKMNSQFYPYMDFSILPENKLKVKGGKTRNEEIHLLY